MRSRFAFLLIAARFTAALAGDFPKGLGRANTVKLPIPKLPVIYKGAKRIAVVIEDAPSGFPADRLPSEPPIAESLITAGGRSVPPGRYCREREILEVRLAVDDKLRQGNELAKVGQWPKAAQFWRDADPKKFPGDKLHNLGMAYEATFYELYWKGEPVAKLEAPLAEARKLHDDAITRDPKEKAHALSQDRLRQAAQLVNRLKTAVPPRTINSKNIIAPGPGFTVDASGTQATFTATPPAVLEFRRLVRLRVRNLAVQPDAERPALETTSVQAYQLSPEDARKHVEEEIAPWLKIRGSLLTYKSTFDAFNTDQKIAREERQLLRSLAARLSLTPDDLKLVEIPGSFTDVP